MKLSLRLFLLPALFLASLQSRAQVTRLSNNTNLETAITLGNIAVLVSDADSLWKTDGTTAGTLKYASNVSVTSPLAYTTFSGKIYFSGTDVNGSELWVTDGTTAGTQLVQDINSGTAGSSPDHFMVFNNALYFFADDGVHGRELWKSDGTAGGASMLKDINPAGSSETNATSFIVFNNTLFFVATDGTSGDELWMTDGTAGGTALVKDINPGAGSSDPQEFFNYGNVFLFSADDGSTGKQVWKSDGTGAGTLRVSEISSAPFPIGPTGFTLFNNKVYFDAFDITNGFEGWVTDGTTAGTTLLKDINPGSENGIPFFTNALFINGQMIFPATSAAEGSELWQSDGSTANTSLFKDINPGADSSNALLFLDAFNAIGINSFHSGLFKGILFLMAKTPAAGTELWKTDGTAGGTVLVKDINPGADSSMTSDSLTTFYTEDNFYFSATDGSAGYELWKTDGTEANTSRVVDINPGPGSSRPEFIGEFNGIILFTATDGDNSSNLRDLYRLDGSFSPLPLTLLNFSGSVYDKSVLLNWSTATEINTAYFDVERSNGLSSFKSIGRVDATGNSTVQKDYSYKDVNAVDGRNNKILYRLKMVDKDGKFSYSKVVAVNILNAGGLVTYPNPVTSELKVTVNSRENQLLTMNIFDDGGKQVYSRQLAAVPGNNDYLLNVGSLQKGSYYIKLVTSNGVETAKFIKN